MNTSLQRLSKYELLVRLGHGGMAEVWKALDTQLQRYVAIKLLRADLQNDPSLVTRLEREARLIASLHHPNIVQIHDFLVSHPSEIEGTVVYMVMDYVEGPTLAQYLQNTSRVGRFPSPNDIVHIFTPICLAIDYAHQKGMIHRDIKPANILLDKRDASKDPIGDPVLTDFGIAKLLGTSLNVRTNTGWWLGTPFYISPEQAKGASGNERSDIYALSVILYEMCTGTVPFQGNSLTAIIMQQVHADPIPPHLVNPVITPALEAVILHGLAKEPGKRFSSASALGIAIAEALNLPAAESLRQMAHHVDEMNSDTHVNSSKPLAANHSQATAIPTLTSQKTAVPLFSLEQQQFSEHVTSLLEAPPDAASATPPNPASVAPPTPNTTPKTVPASKEPGPIPVSLAKSRSAKPRRRSRVLAALALLAISIAALLLLLDLVVLPPMRSDQIVGNAFFVNSGQLNSDNSQGINDELLLDLHNIPALSSGKAYYAWLLGDQAQSEPSITALGKLTVNQGNIHLFYTGNTRHANLLAYQSRLLITEEDASTTPSAYNPDSTTWRYYAQIPQAPGSNGRFHFSMLDHLRHLLSESPELKTRGLHGGLDMWFLRNTQKILEWASAARDDWGNNPDLLHRQI
ncbi:MAG TPA: serine/threonine-protein kinase, partial [Ktedonobacteraceae bacterium]|nr:serine/threonine-protein kinase [Ktedonobacteraceae bacterium]